MRYAATRVDYIPKTSVVAQTVYAALCVPRLQDGKSPSLPHFLAACRRLLGATSPFTNRNQSSTESVCDIAPIPPGPFSVPSCILTFEDRGSTLREDFMRAAHENFSIVKRILLDDVQIPMALRTADHEEVYELYL